jgi:hypothetical protein
MLHDRVGGESGWGDEEPLREKVLFLGAFGLHPLVIADVQRERLHRRREGRRSSHC